VENKSLRDEDMVTDQTVLGHRGFALVRVTVGGEVKGKWKMTFGLEESRGDWPGRKLDE